jgi:hypothetical protein
MPYRSDPGRLPTQRSFLPSSTLRRTRVARSICLRKSFSDAKTCLGVVRMCRFQSGHAPTAAETSSHLFFLPAVLSRLGRRGAVIYGRHAHFDFTETINAIRFRRIDFSLIERKPRTSAAPSRVPRNDTITILRQLAFIRRKRLLSDGWCAFKKIEW